MLPPRAMLRVTLFPLASVTAPLTAQANAEDRTLAGPKERTFVKKWCGECHGIEEPEADLDLVTLLERPLRGDALADVLALRDALRDGDMPPEDAPQPPPGEARRIIAWARGLLANQEPNRDPGRVTMRRLSRVEYENTVRDLLGIPRTQVEEITASFPTDDLGYGFDNNGDALTVSALHIEKYATAAHRLAELAIDTEDPNRPTRRRFELEDHLNEERFVRERDGGAYFSSNRTVSVPVTLPRDGLYQMRLKAWAQQAGNEPARFRVSSSGRELAEFAIEGPSRKTASFVENTTISGGRQMLEVAFVNDYYRPKDRELGKKNIDRNIWIDYVELIGPLDKSKQPPAHRWIMASERSAPIRARARSVVREVMRRAWRRPPTTREIHRTAKLIEQAIADGDSFAVGVQTALRAILVSPNFLFRIEPTRAHTKPSEVAPLGHYEMASRLSYFLWSSLPDERLLLLAKRGKLQDPATLAAEVQRMLRDDRATSLAENFAVQWLELRNLDDVTPDPKRFPSWSPALREAMQRETVLFFANVLRENLDIRELLDADFTFVNQALADHYGIPGVKGKELRRVTLPDRRRGGLLGHASIQTVTSNPTRTSPVKRGKWILENILDEAPPPPPAGNDNFPKGADISTAHGLREQLAHHRRQRVCASCHNRMDVLGLAMQNYDAIGRWRDEDAGRPIDASGQLPGGRNVSGATDLKDVLRDDRAFRACLAKKLFLFALGREVRGTDEVALDAMVRELPDRTTLSDMILAIVQLDAFRSRRTTH